MALFSSQSKDVLKRLANKEFSSVEERDQLLAQLATAQDLRARDVIWMLFRPDRAFREEGVKIVQRLRDPETLTIFVAESKGTPDAAFRAAVALLFSMNVPGIETDLPKLLAAPAKDTKEAREMQELARRVVLEAPVTRATEGLVWQLASTGSGEERVQFLTRIAQGEIDEKAIARWQKLAADPEPLVREKALEVLATRAPASSVPLFVQQLPLVGYSVQQMLIEALSRAAATQPPEFADQLLPLVASGDAGTRMAVMKILMGMKDPAATVKRYIKFTKTLAAPLMKAP